MNQTILVLIWKKLSALDNFDSSLIQLSQSDFFFLNRMTKISHDIPKDVLLLWRDYFHISNTNVPTDASCNIFFFCVKWMLWSCDC